MKKNNFDKSFKRAKTGVSVIFIITILFISAITIGAIILGVKAVNVIRERGLKSIVEEVWEGPDEEK